MATAIGSTVWGTCMRHMLYGVIGMVDTSNAGTGSRCMGFEHNMYDSCSDKGTVGRLVMSAVQCVVLPIFLPLVRTFLSETRSFLQILTMVTMSQTFYQSGTACLF